MIAKGIVISHPDYLWKPLFWKINKKIINDYGIVGKQLKFKFKYKWQDRESHFRWLNVQKKLFKTIPLVTPFSSFYIKGDLDSDYSFFNGQNWSEEDPSVIDQDGGTPT